MATVWIPSLLRDLTGGRETVTVPGASVRQVIDELDRLHPGVRDRLCDGDALRPGLAVIVDSEVARLGLLQPVGPDSEVHFLPAIAGGGDGDHRSPFWVLILAAVLHAELWAAAGVAVFVLAPRLILVEQRTGVRLPYTSERMAQVATGFEQFPPLFAVLPVIDAVVLLALHRAARSRLLRVAWSAVVAGVILFLLIWVAACNAMMMWKLHEALSKSAPPPPAAPGP